MAFSFGVGRGRHRTGAVLAAVAVVASLGVAVARPSPDFWGVWLVCGLLVLVAVAAFFSARWAMAGLLAAVVLQWWPVHESVSAPGQQQDPLAGVGYLLLGVLAVLGLVAVAVGAWIGWLRRRRLAAIEEGPRQVLIG